MPTPGDFRVKADPGALLVREKLQALAELLPELPGRGRDPAADGRHKGAENSPRPAPEP
jgi:hypothetical protein